MSSRPLFRKRKTIWRKLALAIIFLFFAAALMATITLLNKSTFPTDLKTADHSDQKAPAPAPATATNAPSSEANHLVATPDTLAETSASTHTNEEQVLELQQSLQTWQQAWSSKNVKAYLDQYSSEFKPQDGRSRKEWAKIRNERISAKRKIQLELKDINIVVLNDTATVRFIQMYEDETIKTVNHKKLVWINEDGQWLIQQELTE